MKYPVLFILAFALGGCGSLPSGEPNFFQKALDYALPHDFEGDARIGHENPYLKGSVRVGGLKRTPAGWTFKWLHYRRDGWGSHGEIIIGEPPPEKP